MTSARKPNILFIMADQFRWDALGAVGGWTQTPNLDAIAARGLRFANCLTNSPVCIPARISLATGLHCHNTGVWNNCDYTLPDKLWTWMRAVHEAGYRTSLFGKTHLHAHGGDLREREDLLHEWGLDDVDETVGPRAAARCLTHMTAEWERKGIWQAYQDDYAERFSTKPHMVRPSPLGLDDYYDSYVGRQACDYLNNYDRDQPWCCWVSFGGPHEPWDAPEPYASMFDPAAMPPAIPAAESRQPRPSGKQDRIRYGHDLSTEDIAEMRANYAGNVALIDACIGQLLAVLESRGQLANTAIIFTSDHGEMNGDHGLVYKSNFYQSAVRIPLLLAPPRDAANPGLTGDVCTAPVELSDVAPTITELAGGKVSELIAAKSLLPALADPTWCPRDNAISEIDGELLIFDGTWKASFNSEGQIYRLFNIAEDPEEQHNKAGLPAYDDVCAALNAQALGRLLGSQNRTPVCPPSR